MSPVLPEDRLRLHATPVSKQSPSPILNRPLYCDNLRLYSSSPVNTLAPVSAIEADHNGRATEVDLSTGIAGEQHINTGFDDQSLLLKADSKKDATTLLQDVISKITLMPVAFDRITQQSFATSDKSDPDNSSKSYVVTLDSSTSQKHTKDVMGAETDKENLSQKETTSDKHSGIERSVLAGRISDTTRHSSSEVTTQNFQTFSRKLTETTSSQTSSQTTGPRSATKTSNHEWQDTAISGSDISVGLSQQGVVLILSTVLGGILALIVVLILHRFILLHFRRHAGGPAIARSQPAADFLDKKERTLPRTAELSHFSIDT
jgi:hypothetical protein